jgi:hypothetical protein
VEGGGAIVSALRDVKVPLGDYFLIAGGASILAGGWLDAYLLYKWAKDTPVDRALGLGAVAQTLIVAGLNLMVAAVLVGVLRAEVEAEHLELEENDEPTEK